MTACDLGNSTKPWDVQYDTVKVIFEEFYAQVDVWKGRPLFSVVFAEVDFQHDLLHELFRFVGIFTQLLLPILSVEFEKVIKSYCS